MHTKSSGNRDANHIIDELLALLSADHLSRIIDEPLDKALDSFPLDATGPVSFQEFNRIVAVFMQHLHMSTSSRPRKPSYTEALTEGLRIIDMGCRNDEIPGYEAARQEAAHPLKNGMLFVLWRMVHCIKSIRRAEFIHRVLMTCADPTDWELKREMAAKLLQRIKNVCPQTVLPGTSSQLANHWPDLLSLLLEIQSPSGQNIVKDFLP